MNWRENKAEMLKIHRWVKNTLGEASYCTFHLEHKGKFDWANIGHTYQRNINDWIQLCRSCHWILDHPRGKIPIKAGSGKNTHSSMVSFRLQNEDIEIILALYNYNMPISNCCRQMLLYHLKTVEGYCEKVAIAQRDSRAAKRNILEQQYLNQSDQLKLEL